MTIVSVISISIAAGLVGFIGGWVTGLVHGVKGMTALIEAMMEARK